MGAQRQLIGARPTVRSVRRPRTCRRCRREQLARSSNTIEAGRRSAAGRPDSQLSCLWRHCSRLSRCWRQLRRQLFSFGGFDSSPQPVSHELHHRDAHGVSDASISLDVECRATAHLHVRPPILKSLSTLTFDRSRAPHCAVRKDDHEIEFVSLPCGARHSGAACIEGAEDVRPDQLSNAALTAAGSFFFRPFARRRIPFLAFVLKEYVSGVDGWVKTCAKEHTLSSLGDGETLRIEDSPSDGDVISVVRVSGQHMT